ncbi:MAG TPA: sodium:proton antiporter [Balneolaceae bacterium]|nr:sodium:proton antiporter [Balneolaceae bacterium]
MRVKRFFYKVVPFLLIIFLLFPQPASASTSAVSFYGGNLNLWWLFPFVGILLSIAIMPLVAPHFWHDHHGKVAAFWAFVKIISMLVAIGFKTTLYEVLDVYLLEYFPFIILLFSLFTIAGGVRIKGYLKGTPEFNVFILFLGTILASIMGTTGAAMLLIRPLLRANKWRQKKVHIVVFFIFLVANIGGSLTPLGDPPLFMGFLEGVHFFWTTTHLFWPMTFVAIVLLGIYYLLDRYLYSREIKPQPQASEEDSHKSISLEGSFNLLLLVGVLGLVLFSGVVRIGDVVVYHVHLRIANIIRDIGLLLLTGVSWFFTPEQRRIANGFEWSPILEVGKLFAAIFITILAPIAMLQAGNEGKAALHFIREIVFTSNGQPINAMFFWVTGMLSTFLDNTPTYLVFFNAAGGNAQTLMQQLPDTLKAISASAVFFGALTYIGNAPNLLVRSIAESSDVDMPSFVGYMLWSFSILIPIFIVVTWLFI